ncbi:uncharacterized protein LOC115455612 isoform X2 [Manduca sexta]|uniref:Nanos-type domain-containing protein n=2 Tax=Manduca sexta TaxID=7130 RepID=A0A921YP81_MANSE|nr:uncharacterized protein LOC115455612 isoform X2 [Manduca sexta]KAG6442973.1 hypothetical protein O3G_MSEX002601 [Manduca sexta]
MNQRRWTSLGSQLSDDFKSPSFMNLMMGKCTLDEVMKEFQMNGSDSPYNPDEEIWNTRPEELAGLGPGSAYVRQKSWPAPEKTPAQRLPRPHSGDWPPTPIATSTPVNEVSTASPSQSDAPVLTEEQLRVLRTLPDAVINELLGRIQRNRVPGRSNEECRFCKNNGERESYYRSHSLRDAQGRARCPVLRALVCARCGAAGDFAHTLKYCPLTTQEERIKSTAMMRSVRMASGRRRLRNIAPCAITTDNYLIPNKTPSIPSTGNFMRFDTTPSIAQSGNLYNVSQVPLDPLWAALEQKLML